MKRWSIYCVLSLSAGFLVGCNPEPPPQPSVSTVAEADLPEYAPWVLLTPEPIRVSQGAAILCSDPGHRYGPHLAPAIKVYANPAAQEALKGGVRPPLPVGAVIIKEKFPDEVAKRPVAYAAMIKREAGYDPEHGDWEYLYVTLGKQRKVDRGRMANCIECHRSAAGRDYLFGTYLGSGQRK